MFFKCSKCLTGVFVSVHLVKELLAKFTFPAFSVSVLFIMSEMYLYISQKKKMLSFHPTLCCLQLLFLSLFCQKLICHVYQGISGRVYILHFPVKFNDGSQRKILSVNSASQPFFSLYLFFHSRLQPMARLIVVRFLLNELNRVTHCLTVTCHN